MLAGKQKKSRRSVEAVCYVVRKDGGGGDGDRDPDDGFQEKRTRGHAGSFGKQNTKRGEEVIGEREREREVRCGIPFLWTRDRRDVVRRRLVRSSTKK